MASNDVRRHNKPVAIAPAPTTASSTDFSSSGTSPRSSMPYTCQTCAKRKVKCDKASPACSTCRRGKLDCFYQAPPPRRRKRKLSGDINERLAHYEHILKQHGLLPEYVDTSASFSETTQGIVPLDFIGSETSRTGRLLASHGKSRYVDSTLWRNFGVDEERHLSDDEDEDQMVNGVGDGAVSDPLTSTFLGHRQSLLGHHPTHIDAIMMWKMHIERVEPLCKILHIPTAHEMINRISQQPATATTAEECLLFAIYHFSIFSTTEDECFERFRQPRATLMQRYQFSTRQALVNAAFLKTTETSVMQALVLFLIPARFFYDPHTYWILTGVAVRIAQRMGLHRDGEKLGLNPFDDQMSRRLFYQLIPLDGIASQISGTNILTKPDTWDTPQPLNLNDDQIWPGMMELPVEQKGATDMIFCLARSCLGSIFVRAGKSLHSTNDYRKLDLVINEAENEVEEKYIRYCDVVNPLHFLTISFARSAITAMRIRTRLPKMRDNTATEAERRELFRLAMKIIETDHEAYTDARLKIYMWYMRSFFLWGTWDSLIFIATNLRNPDFLSPVETGAAWKRMEQVYNNHDEFLKSKRVLHSAIGRLLLEAWDVTPQSGTVPEPSFITVLRALGAKNERKQHTSDTQGNAEPQYDSPPPTSTADANSGHLTGASSLSIDFDLDAVDWSFWEQMIQDHHAQDDEHQGGFSY